MPFARPSLDELRLRVRQDLMNRLPGTDAMLRWNNLRVIADVEAGTVHMLYGRLVWSFQQLFPDTAEGPFLDRWASIWGVPRRPATQAFGPAQFTANAGTSYPEGYIVQRVDGTQFAIMAAAFEVTGIIDVMIQAVLPGAAGNTEPGAELTAVNTITGVNPHGYVQGGGLVGGADLESDELLRERLLLRIQSPPHGGTATDYIQWMMEVPGVTRAWCYPLELGPGTVVGRFMMDGARASAQGIPEPGDVALVQAHIDTVKPVTAVVTIEAPVPLPVDITIGGLEDDTPDTRTAIQAELLDFFVRTAEPGLEVYPSQIVGAINTAPGVKRFRLLDPLISIVPQVGEIAILGTLTFNTF
jgi:uncharacterized phage protein gp47/JayE